MSIFQLLAALFAFFMLYIVNIHRKKAALSFLEVGAWYAVWFLFIIIALFPNLLLGIVNIFHFARVFDLLTVLALMIITTLVIYNYFQQKENSKKMEEYIRRKAVSNHEMHS